MVTVGEKTKRIVQLHKDGLSVEEIAEHFNISTGSVLKRLKSFEKIEQGFYSPGNPNYKLDYQKPVTWTTEQMKEGFDRFLKENGRLPTAYEIDDTPYLPSARQIQRRFGGVSKLRLELGYGEVHFGKGVQRGDRSRATGLRGGAAEDELEKMLVKRFGELFVQSEKRFGEIRNRVDFVVYAKDVVVGIDVFATDDKRTIIKNIAVKIPKYISFPKDVPLFFVVWTDKITQQEIDRAIANMSKLALLPHLKVVNADSLFENLIDLETLIPPMGYKSFSH